MAPAPYEPPGNMPVAPMMEQPAAPMPYQAPAAGQPAPVTGQMPQTGFEDLPGGALLALAMAALVLLAAAGWALERRRAH